MQLKVISSLFLFGINLCFGISSVAQLQRPNIIYIMTDDMGYADLSGYGQKAYSTPNLDKLASQGLRFSQAYSAGPLCTPTRAGYMTGRYPARIPVGLIEPLTASAKDSTYGLTPEFPSIGTLMKQGGYETVLIGKWHLGLLPQHSPVDNGFDHFYGFHSGAADYISHKGDGGKPDLYENNNPVTQEGYLTDLFTQRTVAFLKGAHSKPFFLTLNYNAPHWPWQGPADKAYDDTADFRAGGSAAIYAAMMKSLDDGVGAVMKALDETGLADQTIVIFTNDNGGERYSNNGGLAKSKGSLWEGGIRVPAFIRWTGIIPPGGTSTQPVITMDWTATILAAAGAKPHPDFPLDGINLMPLCRGKGKEIERTFYWRTSQRKKQKAIRDGNWKYLQDEGEEFLFDLGRDPGEKVNLKATNPEKFRQLKARHSEWEKTVLPPIPL
ncbi:sulfatase [Flavihumibacter sp. R14]|nr:sulfatase [Flavihumibacter soli]